MAAIPKKPQASTKNVDQFIGGARASQADQQRKLESKSGGGKKMFSARLDPATVKKIKVWSGLADKTKEDIAQEAFDLYFSDKDVPT